MSGTTGPSSFPTKVLKLTGVTGNTTAEIPAGNALLAVLVENTTANAVTGGVKIGTTAGGTDVVVALTVGASALTFVADAAVLKRLFSMSSAQTLHIQAVIAWNSANLNINFVLANLNQ